MQLDNHILDRPRSTDRQKERGQRRAMLNEPLMAPLSAFTARLRANGMGEVPEFDHLDGGVNASILFLFEKPGPMTAEGEGSGYISRNNDDPTAEATFGLMRQAGIPRKLTLLWNAVPWWNGTRKITAEELKQGVACVRELISLVPDLRAVVLVGGKAARAKPLLESCGLALFSSDHPSPIVRASRPERWKAIPEHWARAMRLECH